MRSFGGGSRGSRSQPSRDDQTPDVPVNWQRLFGYLGPYKFRMVVAILALAFYSAVGLIFPLVIVQLLDSVLKQQNFDQLNRLAGALIGLFLAQSVLSFIQSYNLTFMGERIVFDLRTKLYSHLHELSLDFYTQRR